MDKLTGTAQCPVCASRQIHFIQDYPHRAAIFDDCSIVGCNNCQLVFVHPMPDHSAIDEYNANYFENAHGGMQLHPLTVAFHSAINRLRAEHAERFLKRHNKNVLRVAEIGPGGGQFASHWLAMHPGTDYTAIESDETCYDRLREIGLRVHSSLDEIASDAEFDLVVISHVLEHTPDPVSFINGCTKHLAKGGVLFVEVPCLDYKHKKDVEPHLLFFDKPSFQFLLNTTGFEKAELGYFGRTITDLKKKPRRFSHLLNALRNAMMVRGILFPFISSGKGLENMSGLERAVISPSFAHREQHQPSWWLRAMAIKK